MITFNLYNSPLNNDYRYMNITLKSQLIEVAMYLIWPTIRDFKSTCCI